MAEKRKKAKAVSKAPARRKAPATARAKAPARPTAPARARTKATAPPKRKVPPKRKAPAKRPAPRPAAKPARKPPGKPARPAPRPRAAGKPAPAGGGPDPEGFFVARVRGEEAVRDSPHPMTEGGDDRWTEEEAGTADAEDLGDLPWGYGDDAFTALARDPRTLFLYWDFAPATLARAFEGLDHPRVQLWVFARTEGGHARERTIEFALESRCFYVHDLEPGRAYRAEIHALDRAGRERLLGAPSNELVLPSEGPSPVLDDRFAKLPWDLPLGRLVGPGRPGGPFPDDARTLLARLSDASRFGPTWGGSGEGR